MFSLKSDVIVKLKKYGSFKSIFDTQHCKSKSAIIVELKKYGPLKNMNPLKRF